MRKFIERQTASKNGMTLPGNLVVNNCGENRLATGCQNKSNILLRYFKVWDIFIMGIGRAIGVVMLVWH